MAAFPVDAEGQAHPRASGEARIVSLVPSITELLFSLGLGPLVIGRTTFCIHPRAGVAAVKRVGGTKTPNLGRILSLGATHAIVNVDENRRCDARDLQAAGVRVVSTHPMSLDDNPGLFRLLGGIFDRAAQAESLCREFLAARARLQAAVRDRPRRRVLYLIWRAPFMTVSRDTYVSRTLAAAGLDTVGHRDDRRYPEIDVDARLLADVDEVLLSSEPYPFKQGHLSQIRELAAGARPAISLIDAEMTSWYGSRAIAGCDYLAQFTARPRTQT